MAMEPKGERVGAIVLFNKRLFAHLQLTKRRFKQLLNLQVRLHGSQRRSSLATAPLRPGGPLHSKLLVTEVDAHTMRLAALARRT